MRLQWKGECKQLISDFCSFLFQFVFFCAVFPPVFRPPIHSGRKFPLALFAGHWPTEEVNFMLDSLVKVGKCKHRGVHHRDICRYRYGIKARYTPLQIQIQIQIDREKEEQSAFKGRFNYLNVVAVIPCFQPRLEFLILVAGTRWRCHFVRRGRFLGGNPDQIALGLFD